MDKTIYGQSKVMGFDPKVINLVILVVIGGNKVKVLSF